MIRYGLALCLVGCSELAFEGTVVDHGGSPLPGALVTSEPGRCAGTTNAQGIYYARCKPGTYTLTATLSGFYPASQPVSATEKDLYPVPQLTLLPVPSQTGPSWLLPDGAEALQPADIERRDAPRERRYCLAETAAPGLSIPSGSSQFIDRDPTVWRLLQLDDEGCARHEIWSAGAWRTEWEQTIETQRRALGDDALHTLTLTEGDYLLIPWSEGRLLVNTERSEAAGAKRYVGYRITAQ